MAIKLHAVVVLLILCSLKVLQTAAQLDINNINEDTTTGLETTTTDVETTTADVETTTTDVETTTTDVETTTTDVETTTTDVKTTTTGVETTTTNVETTTSEPEWPTGLPVWAQPQDLVNVDAYDTGKGELSAEESTTSEQKSWQINVNNETGYDVMITLNFLSVEPNNDDFLLIMPGSFADNSFLESEVLTGNISKPVRFFLPYTQTFYVKYSASPGAMGFQITYERSGSPPTTPPPIIDHPTPPTEGGDTYTVFLSGVSITNFLDTEFQEKFKAAVQSVAAKYCTDNNITFIQKPPEEMVFLNQISSCQSNWPASETCIAVQHFVYVSGDELPLTIRVVRDYELTTDHLKDMWAVHGTDTSISNLNLQIYIKPTADESVLWTAVGVSLVLAVVLVVIVVMFRLRAHTRAKRTSQSDQVELFEGVELRRKSKPKPAAYQTVPDLWNTQSDVVVVTPGSSSIVSTPPAVRFRVPQVETPPSEQLSPVQTSYGGALFFNFDLKEKDEEIEI